MIQNLSHLLLHRVGLVQLGTGKECTNLWITALFELCFRLVEILNCNTCPPSSGKGKAAQDPGHHRAAHSGLHVRCLESKGLAAEKSAQSLPGFLIKYMKHKCRAKYHGLKLGEENPGAQELLAHHLSPVLQEGNQELHLPYH